MQYSGPLLMFFIASRSVEGLHVWYRVKIWTETALQLPDALPTVLRSALWTTLHTAKLRRTLLSYAAPYWAIYATPFCDMPHPIMMDKNDKQLAERTVTI